MNASTLVQKLWNYCNVLRDNGLSYTARSHTESILARFLRERGVKNESAADESRSNVRLPGASRTINH